jgi:hypothetical protein
MECVNCVIRLAKGDMKWVIGDMKCAKGDMELMNGDKKVLKGDKNWVIGDDLLVVCGSDCGNGDTICADSEYIFADTVT